MRGQTDVGRRFSSNSARLSYSDRERRAYYNRPTEYWRELSFRFQRLRRQSADYRTSERPQDWIVFPIMNTSRPRFVR